MTTPSVIDRAVQDFQAWIARIRETGGLADDQRAYDALRGTLHTLRDRLPVDEATDFGAGLPTMVRGIYYEAYAPRKTPEKTRSETQFLESLSERIAPAPDFDHVKGAEAVFACIDERLEAGQVDHVILALPKDVRDHWPDEARRRAEAREAA